MMEQAIELKISKNVALILAVIMALMVIYLFSFNSNSGKIELLLKENEELKELVEKTEIDNQVYQQKIDSFQMTVRKVEQDFLKSKDDYDKAKNAIDRAKKYYYSSNIVLRDSIIWEYIRANQQPYFSR